MEWNQCAEGDCILMEQNVIAVITGHDEGVCVPTSDLSRPISFSSSTVFGNAVLEASSTPVVSAA